MKTKIIADCCSNHMGNLQIALEMVDIAAEIGVDIVKFQSWTAASLRKDYPDYSNVYERHRRSELTDEFHYALIERCKKRKVEFLTTCFDVKRIEFLASLGIDKIKVASSDCGSYTLLDALSKNFSQVIVSTGMSTDSEVVEMVKRMMPYDPIVLHCVSIYPTPLAKINLRRMNWIRSLGVRAGFSDHSLGIQAGMLAISMGAEVLEKHFTISRRLPGKDQSMSTEAHEFEALVTWNREVHEIMGVERPSLSDDELNMRSAYIGKWGCNK